MLTCRGSESLKSAQPSSRLSGHQLRMYYPRAARRISLEKRSEEFRINFAEIQRTNDSSCARLLLSEGFPMNDFFRSLANSTASAVGSPWAFIAALAIVIIWALLGPWFNFSDTWQLTINTTASIVPSLMVF